MKMEIGKKGLTGNVVTDVALWIVFIIIGIVAIWFIVKKLFG